MEHIVIVDENDTPLGTEEKEKCHDGDGILHRAFLSMVFNKNAELILAKRSREKRLWPGIWDGTVASHVGCNEDYERASRRRLFDEIGLRTNGIRYLFKFQYHAKYLDVGSEKEICAVTMITGVDEKKIVPARKEISEIRTISQDELKADFRENQKEYTPWLRIALEHMIKLQML